MVTIGRLVARKATTQLVDVLAASAIPNAHLLIIGDGPDAAAIRQRAADLGVAERVHLPGQVTEADKYAALAIADAFVSTSQHEGFGLVFLEAMACGLPIVCYDRGGQTDFLASGETGFVVQAERHRRVQPRGPCNSCRHLFAAAPRANGTDSWSKTIS